MDLTDFKLTKLVGVGETKADRFEKHGITTLFDLVIRSPKTISELTNLEKETAEKHCSNARHQLEELKLIRPLTLSARELLDYENEVIFRINCGCVAIDGTFGGGVPSEAITEVYGEFGSGKTQYCLSLAVEAVCKHNYKVLFIDCEGTFKSKRFIEIAISRGYIKTEEEGLKLLDSILTERVVHSDDVTRVIEHSSKTILENDIKLVIIDGATGKFREDYIGRGNLSDRQGELNQLIGYMAGTAEVCRCVLIYTNQVMSDANSMFGDPIRPIGGNIVGHGSRYRVYFKKSGKKRVCKMVDSPEHASGESIFYLNADGVSDYETIEERDRALKESKKKLDESPIEIKKKYKSKTDDIEIKNESAENN